MSTQSSGHPPTHFSITTPFKHVRLIEVPDDLLSTITNPSTERLKFKSALPALSSSSSSATQSRGQSSKEGIMYLCSSDKAWAVKQVSTSNSVYLIQPCRPPTPPAVGLDSVPIDTGMDTEMQDGDNTNDKDALSTASYGAVTAVAQVGNFLELHPIESDKGTVESAVIDLLAIYHPLQPSEDVDLDFQATNEAKVTMSMRRLVDDVAAPDAVVRKVCAKLGVFESARIDERGTRCMIPSAKALLDTWMKINEGCAIEGIRLDRSINVVRVLNVLVAEVDSAIAERMLEVDGMFDELGLFEEDKEDRELKPSETCRFIAALMLSTQIKAQKQIELSEFMTRWTDLVPSSFVKYCTIETLTSRTPMAFEVGSDDAGTEVIRWSGVAHVDGVVFAPALLAGNGAGFGSEVGGVEEGARAAITNTMSSSSSATTDKKRKWHEKFGAQRNKR